MTVIAILDGCIQAAVGRGGKRPVVRGLSSVPYEGDLERSLGILFDTCGLPKGDICLLLPTELAATRLLTLPSMGKKATAEAVAHEMEESLVTDYLPLPARGPQRRYPAAAVEERVLRDFEEVFSRLGAKLRRVSTPTESLLKVLSTTEETRDQSFLWIVTQGGAAEALLVEQGQCTWQGRSRLFAPPGTAERERELEELVRDVERFRGPVSKVLYTGPEAQGLEAFPPCGRFGALPEGKRFEEYIYVLGSFLRMGREGLWERN